MKKRIKDVPFINIIRILRHPLSNDAMKGIVEHAGLPAEETRLRFYGVKVDGQENRISFNRPVTEQCRDILMRCLEGKIPFTRQSLKGPTYYCGSGGLTQIEPVYYSIVTDVLGYRPPIVITRRWQGDEYRLAEIVDMESLRKEVQEQGLKFLQDQDQEDEC